jgi:hypothetical protein
MLDFASLAWSSSARQFGDSGPAPAERIHANLHWLNFPVFYFRFENGHKIMQCQWFSFKSNKAFIMRHGNIERVVVCAIYLICNKHTKIRISQLQKVMHTNGIHSNRLLKTLLHSTFNTNQPYNIPPQLETPVSSLSTATAGVLRISIFEPPPKNRASGSFLVLCFQG